ncbi:MAG: hypothetical protein DMG14_34475 [Acidobacteria bacterium]|nr:MAG: hypothetical protein DMG14_34475 [Acidobacteriota bacterium]
MTFPERAPGLVRMIASQLRSFKNCSTLPSSGQKPGRQVMNKLIVSAVIVASGMIAAAALSQQTQPPASGFQAKPYFEMPLEKDPSRIVRLQSVVIPPGAGNQFHRHPGDQWWAVQEGEVTLTVRGQQPSLMKAGDFVYVQRGTIHRNQNLSKLPARSIELNITDKDKPQTEQVP